VRHAGSAGGVPIYLAPMRVELLYAEDDPASMPTRQNLVEVLTEDAFETPIQMIAVASAEDAELLGMRGTPTIRIDGEDIDPDSAGPAGLQPRRYGDGNGGSVPDKDLIRRAVERARGWSHARRPDGGR
jgi:hypothetical protein